MFKEGDQWKIFNTIVKQNPNYPFSASLPALVGLPMQDFTLPIYGGGEFFTLSKNKGKNVLLVFPRGAVANGWCTICQYQYVDFSMREKLNNLKKKYDLAIVFVLPFTKERTDEYLNAIPDAVARVEQWKSPAATATVRQKDLAEFVKKVMPQKYEVKKGEVPNNLPILLDAEKKVSKSLKIFTTNWDGQKAEQNIPTMYIIDKKGNLAFKYHSQTTFDRLSLDYLIKMIEKE
jgi:peroxiredoxin